MPGKWTKDFNFVTAAFSSKSLVVAMTPEAAAEEKEDLTIFAAWQNLQWRLIGDAYLWSVVGGISAVVSNPAAVFLGMWGEVLFTDGQNVTEGSIAPASGELPEDRGPMCGIGVIDNFLYAVGMGRQVYNHDRKGQWLCLDHLIRPVLDDESIVGLNSIDGFSSNELYTVGFNGEIWWREVDRWIQVDSPTNMPLSHVFCDGNDRAYICGRNGTLLAGRRDRWLFIAQDETDDDLWSIARYQDHLYFLGTHGLYLLENDELTPVPIAGETIGFCQHLLVGEGSLWLLGPKDLLSFDGSRWERID